MRLDPALICVSLCHWMRFSSHCMAVIMRKADAYAVWVGVMSACQGELKTRQGRIEGGCAVGPVASGSSLTVLCPYSYALSVSPASLGSPKVVACSTTQDKRQLQPRPWIRRRRPRGPSFTGQFRPVTPPSVREHATPVCTAVMSSTTGTGTFPVNVSAFHDPSSNFTIPYNTWYDLSNELTTLLKLAFPRLETQLVTTMLTTLSTGESSSTASCLRFLLEVELQRYTQRAPSPPQKLYCESTVYPPPCSIAPTTLTPSPPRGKGRKPVALTLLAITLLMYLLAFTYWTTVLAGQFRTLHNLRANAATTLSLVSPLDCFLILSTKEGTALPAHCATIPDVSEFVAIAPTWDFTQECAGTVALAINVRACFCSRDADSTDVEPWDGV